MAGNSESLAHGSVSFVSYDCATQSVVLNVVGQAPDFVAVYGYDKAGPPVVSNTPHPHATVVPGITGLMYIFVPHQNNSQQVLVAVWTINQPIQVDIDCSTTTLPPTTLPPTTPPPTPPPTTLPPTTPPPTLPPPRFPDDSAATLPPTTLPPTTPPPTLPPTTLPPTTPPPTPPPTTLPPTTLPPTTPPGAMAKRASRSTTKRSSSGVSSGRTTKKTVKRIQRRSLD